MSSPVSLPLDPAPPARAGAGAERVPLVRRARRLAWLGVAWHVVEAVVAVGAGVAAGSIALVGLGADSVIEGAAGFVVLWLVARSFTATAERRSQQLIAVSKPR